MGLVAEAWRGKSVLLCDYVGETVKEDLGLLGKLCAKLVGLAISSVLDRLLLSFLKPNDLSVLVLLSFPLDRSYL